MYLSYNPDNLFRIYSKKYISNYYLIISEQEVHALANVVQIYTNENLGEGNLNDQNVWRTMTKNYMLRNGLLDTSIANLELLRAQIAMKVPFASSFRASNLSS